MLQDIQNLYLKRKGISKGRRYWAVITYGKYDEDCSKEYSIELEECHEDDLLEMIDALCLDCFPSLSDLRSMGWRGKIKNNKTLFHNLSNDQYYLSKNNTIASQSVQKLLRKTINTIIGRCIDHGRTHTSNFHRYTARAD